MIKNNLFIKNNIQQKHLNNNSLKKLSKEFKKIILNINHDIKNTTKTLNVLNDKFKFNFKIKDFKKFNISLKGEITLVVSQKLSLEKNLNILDESDKTKIKQLIRKLRVKDIEN